MNWGVNGCMSCPDNNGAVSTNNNPAIYWGLFDSQHYDEPTINGCSLGTERKFYFYFFSPLAPLRGKLLNLNPEPLLQQFGALLSNVHRCPSVGH